MLNQRLIINLHRFIRRITTYYYLVTILNSYPFFSSRWSENLRNRPAFGLTILHTLFFLEIGLKKKRNKIGMVFSLNSKHNLCFDEKLRSSNISDLQRKELTNGFGAQEEIFNIYIHWLDFFKYFGFLNFSLPQNLIILISSFVNWSARKRVLGLCSVLCF